MRRTLLVIPLLLTACGTPQPPTAVASLPPAAISTATAALVERSSVELLPGTVRADRAATIQARVPGVVARIVATPGTMVAAGALLIELDAKELSAKRAQATAQAAQAAADHARAKLLLERQAMTQAEFDAASARAAATAAAADEAAIMVGYTAIAAPFAGVVVRRHAEIGDLVAPGRPLIDLEDSTSLRLEIAVPESLSGQIAVGSSLRVQVPAAGIDEAAPVVEIIPAADPVSRTVLAKLALPTAKAGLRSGQFGRVAVATAGGSQLTVPAAAVVQRGQLDAVFVIDQGIARLRLVRLGGCDGDRWSVRAGLTAGEVVAATGAATLTDGQPVNAAATKP
jgi:RND family efflux transporter MFP subunit